MTSVTHQQNRLTFYIKKNLEKYFYTQTHAHINNYAFKVL